MLKFAGKQRFHAQTINSHPIKQKSLHLDSLKPKTREEAMKLKNLLLILSISSSLLISSNAVPSYQILKLHQLLPASAPIKAPESSASAISVNNPVSGAPKAANKFIDPEIVQFCADTSNPTLCAEFISEVDSTGSFDPIKVVEIALEETLKEAANVAEKITKMQNDPSTDKKLKHALDICTSEYGDMVNAIKEAMDLMQQQNIVDAYSKFNAVISNQASCDGALNEILGVNHVPFEADDKTLAEFDDYVLALLNKIVNGYKM